MIQFLNLYLRFIFLCLENLRFFCLCFYFLILDFEFVTTLEIYFFIMLIFLNFKKKFLDDNLQFLE